jgi:hypothetical protein
VATTVLLAALAAAPAASGDEAALLEKIHQLELRIQDLEANRPAPVSATGPPDWTRNIRLSGSANTGYFGGQKDSLFDPGGFKIWDARIFLDAHLGEDVRMGETTILRDAGLTFEWNLVRIGKLENDVGELYADFQGIGDADWANVQFGRFMIPVGEAYLRYAQGYSNKPFISNPVGGPWWWDEGLRGYGFVDGGRFGYVWSISDGDTPFSAESSGANQFTLKLITQPLPWLRLSLSGLHSGKTGTGSQPAAGALWLGETWGRAFGSGTSVASYQNGLVVADGPNQLEQTWLAAGDAIFDFEDRARLWLAYGRYEMDSRNASSYDRALHYWIAELLLRGAWLAPALRPFYAGVRASALGTYDDGKGYLLDFRRASTLGYNMESLTAYSAVLGWEITPNLRLRAEYTHQSISLVEGVTRAIRSAASPADYFAFEVGAGF